MKNPLPDGVHMLTLEKYFGLELNPNEYIIRFEHFYEADEAMNALGTDNITFSLVSVIFKLLNTNCTKIYVPFCIKLNAINVYVF